MLRPCLLPLSLLLASSLPGADAYAQSIQRCSNADGSSVFTDKPCELLKARPRISSGSSRSAATAGAIDPQRQCPRRLSQLVAQIQQAIDNSDSNRLASLYWWGGHGDALASRQLERLEAIVQRPLVDIAPVYPQPRAVLDIPAATAPDNGSPGAEALPVTRQPAPLPRPRPYALRIQQTLANGSTPASTVLQLRRHYGCFWISL